MATDLTTRYLGLELAHPVVASACPLTGSLDSLQALADAGAAAVVLPSLFEEQVEHDALLGGLPFDEASFNIEAHGGYFPDLDDYNTGADEYLDLLTEAKNELSIPVIASLNGTSEGGWTHYAAALEGEGADALELNIYHLAADSDLTGEEVETRYLRLVEQVRSEISIPLAVKIGPFFSSPANMVRTTRSGRGQWCRDVQSLLPARHRPRHARRCSQPGTERPARDATGVALDRDRVRTGWLDLAATTGVHDAEGAVKLVLAGASVTMMASALLHHGPAHVRTVVDGLEDWFTERGLQLARPGPGEREPEVGGRPVDLRAGQLHAHPHVVSLKYH